MQPLPSSRTVTALIFATYLSACGSNSDTTPDSPPGDGNQQGTTAGEPQDVGDAGATPSRTTVDAATLGDAEAGGDAGLEPATPIPLPKGSQERDGVVNLVDAEAAAQLEAYFLDQKPVHVALRQGLTAPVNRFLEHYLDEYDFLFFFPDHTIEGTSVAGKFEAVTRPAEPGGGGEIEIRAAGYKTNGRVKGAIGIMFIPDFYGPMAHETMHYWGNDLDPRFGFGSALGGGYGPHWGFTSVNGQLGGFDPQTLRCQSPSGALPPACTPVSGSPGARVRYVAHVFAPQGNFAPPYSSLERYLMGLIPASEVPTSFQLIEQGQLVADSYDAASETVVVEGSGIKELPFSEIVARHGTKRLLPENERHFRAAFVVISATGPAPDKVMSDVARWAALFGARQEDPQLPSFEDVAGGLATMDTLLGTRRTTAQPVPPPREALTCDVLAQDCPRSELGCFWFAPSVCALSGQVQEGKPCNATYACAPGLECVSAAAMPNEYVCKPYCDPSSSTSPKSCEVLCPGHSQIMTDGNQQTLGAYCLPG